MKGKIYKLHRTLSIIIAIPVLLWATSGFMHPLMTNIRPAIATQSLLPAIIDSNHIQVPLKEALNNNRIDSFTQCRLIHIDTNWFYQVQRQAYTAPLYISAKNGKPLNAGDWLYAQYLARQFLEGQQFSAGQGKAIPGIITSTSLPADHDCCNEATSCVLKSKGSRVINAHILAGFDNEYKSINRLLPVYKVSFDRPDGIRVYVETTQDRFAFAMDNRRAVFDEIFRLFHTWGWLDAAGNLKYVIEGVLALLAFFTTLLGIYIFFTTNSKRSNGNKLLKARRNHRYTAITVALFTLLWSGSGAYHALSKLHVREQAIISDEHFFSSADIHLDPRQLSTIVKMPVVNIGLAYMDHSVYWRVTTNNHSDATGTKDLMKEMHAGLPSVTYVNDNSGTILPKGEQQYARELATRFSGHASQDIRNITLITHFNDEYNFTDKRLPVWKLDYATHHHERYYVETCSGQLAAYINDRDIPEGYSFSVFHKHHFMDWGGKTIRDLSTMIWALAQVIMVAMGLTLYFRWRIKRFRGQGKRDRKTV